jgi:hypothetical protein
MAALASAIHVFLCYDLCQDRKERRGRTPIGLTQPALELTHTCFRFAVRRSAALLLDLALQRLDFRSKRGVVRNQQFDLAHRMENRGVIAPAKPAADFGQ